MKRNMKFLLLLAIFTSSIMAAYFITGCGDDSTVIEFPENVTNDTTVIIEETDQVIGTVHGTVSDGWDNAFLAGVTITWINGDSTYTTTTDAGGYWSTPVDLVSGEYNFTFNVTGHAVTSGWTNIPELDELRAGVADRPAGNIYVSDTLDMRLLPLTANVTGVVYTALPAPPVKDGEPSLALDDPTLVSVAEGVTVILDYGFHIHPNKYTATTIANGTYTFNNVPLWTGAFGGEAPKDGQPGMALATAGEVDLLTLPFTVGDSSFESTAQTNIEMVPGTTEMPNVFAPLVGGNQVITSKPVILTYNFETPGFTVTDSLVINFSKPMETATMTIDVDGVDFAATWDALDMVLTINPALSLVPDETYIVTIDGFATDGLELYQGPWERVLVTQLGIRFVSTNLDDYGDDNNPFKDFPLNGDITVTFDMNVDLTNANGWVVLYDAGNDREVNATISASGATVTVNPADSLKSYATYELDFLIYSGLRGDAVDDDEITGDDLEFTTLNTATTPAAPTGFVLDMGTGWKANWNTLIIDFKWDSVSGAEYYQIFAKDNHLNTDFIVVEDNIDDVSFHTWQTGTVTLSDAANLSFDLFDDDILIVGVDTSWLQTPFSDYTEIYFQVRAVNSAGAGAFSANTITVGDETVPTVAIVQGGVADNAARAVDTTFAINFGGMEYVDSVHFVFTEAGGDPAYVFTEADVTWVWDVDMRGIDTAYVTIPAGATGSADFLTVNVWDNSGNMGTDTTSLFPWIVVDMPNDTTMDFMAPNYTVEWTSTDPLNSYLGLNVWFSLDGGTTWLDSASSLLATADDGAQLYTVDDTLYSVNALIGIQDTTAGGGWMWNSDAFTWTGLKLLAPDSAIWDTMTIVYDDGGVDSTDIPFSFASAGLDSIVIVYTDDNWVTTFTHDTVLANAAVVDTISYTWNAPDLGANYNCEVGIRDLDGARPIHTFGWNFPVINDYTDITAPATAAHLNGGATDTIRWDTTAYVPHLTSALVQIDYSLNRGATWVSLSNSTGNDGKFAWVVPANGYANDSAQVRIRDITDLNTLDVTGNFTISGIKVLAPAVDTQWVGGTSHNILWASVDAPGTVDIWYSLTNFATDSVLIVAATADDGSYAWSVPNTADSTVWIRLWTNTDDCMTTSDVFLIDALKLLTPNGGEILANGANTTVTWTEYGSAIDSVYIEYSSNAGGWVMVDSMANTGTYTWLVPDVPSDSVSVRVSQVTGNTGSDVCDAPFKIGGLVMTAPNGAESWIMGVAQNITWQEFGITGTVKLEYTINNGIDWWTIASADAIVINTKTFSWNMNPAVDVNLTGTSTDCFVRVTENNPADPSNIMTDASNAKFTITKPVLAITAPNGGETWTIGGAAQDITWTETNITSAVKLEYTLDGTNWFQITNATAIAAGTGTFSWPMSAAVDGDLVPSVIAEVRVTTVTGVTITDESDAVFTIN